MTVSTDGDTVNMVKSITRGGTGSSVVLHSFGTGHSSTLTKPELIDREHPAVSAKAKPSIQ